MNGLGAETLLLQAGSLLELTLNTSNLFFSIQHFNIQS